MYHLEVYRGDTWMGPEIVLPDLSPFGGPSDLSTAALTARIRSHPDGALLATMTVDVLDPAARRLRLRLTSEQTANLQSGVWDLAVRQTIADAINPTREFVGTVLRGEVAVTRDVS